MLLFGCYLCCMLISIHPYLYCESFSEVHALGVTDILIFLCPFFGCVDRSLDTSGKSYY